MKLVPASLAAAAAAALAVVRRRRPGVLASGGLGRLESRAIGDEVPQEPAQTPRRA